MHDHARIHVQAGAGGDGCLSFRREAHVPKGGPDGGDGGRGGDVVLVCDDSLRDLESFRRRSHFKARRGGHGEGSLRHGADGDTLELSVPPGTEVVVERDGTRYDLVAAVSGRWWPGAGPGGRGNKRFAGPTHQTPRFAERGLPGEETWLTLQLKLLADVGLDRAAQCREVLAAGPADPRPSEGRRVSVHDALAGAGHAADRHPPAGDRRHPGADRGRQRRRGARARVPRPRRAHPAAGPRPRPQSARRIGSGRQPRSSWSASWSSTTPGWPRCPGSSRCPSPTWSTPAPPRRHATSGGGGSGPTCRCSSPRR